MSGRLIIHTGDHKTGSTSLQVALRRDEITIDDTTILYPIIGNQFHHNHLVAPIRRVQNGYDAPVLSKYRERIVAEQADITVLSAEMLEFVPPRAIERLVSGPLAGIAEQLTIVRYVRPHAARIQSMGIEFVKLGWHRDDPAGGFDKILNDFEYAPRLRSWKMRFGEDMIIRPFIRSELHGRSVVHDFVHSIAGSNSFSVPDATRANESVSVEDLMRILVVQRERPELGHWERHTLGWALSVYFNGEPSTGTRTRFRLHREFAERVRSTYEKDAIKLDRDYFGGRSLFRDELDRAVDEAPAEPFELAPEAWLSADEIRQLKVLARVLAAASGPTSSNLLRQAWIGELVGEDLGSHRD